MSDRNNDKSQHIAIIGTGSGAFAAAIKATENGAKVSIIEGADVIGGTCVNIGCVPSKIMIRGAHIAHMQNHHSFAGIELNKANINRREMVAQQQSLVEKLRHLKYESIIENNENIELLRGKAHFKDENTLVIVQKNNQSYELKADKFLLAVGARAMIPEINRLSDTPYWTSTDALIAEEIPEKLIVLGGSVIALELAQAFSQLGSSVTIMARSTLLSKEDKDVGEKIKNILQEEGVDVQLNTVPDSVIHNENGFIVTTEKGEFVANKLLVATGRKSNADTLNLNNAGVEKNANGDIIISDYMQTTAKHIYAAGDCTSQPQFVYVAAAAGTRAARNMTGENVALDLSVVPEVVFTAPQIATVGLSEKEAKAEGLSVNSKTLDLENVPRALANMDTRGFIKLIAEKESGRIVGCQIVASEAGEVIQTAALAIVNQTTIEDLANQLFPYLTMVEGLKLCAQTFNKDVSQLSCCAG
ncbi:Mercuric ion reductase [hydrothermal vent metagenome]|uniref:Mercuric reductase n=1 Tax=hydrothermal vent metagenome TaxID=652676 RepID=A0A3B0Y3H3_9ZZZZ